MKYVRSYVFSLEKCSAGSHLQETTNTTFKTKNKHHSISVTLAALQTNTAKREKASLAFVTSYKNFETELKN